MRAVVQRVSSAEVKIDGQVCASISKGLLVLVGITDTDCQTDINYIAKKVANLRIFDDENGVPNLSVLDTAGEVLLVSQFTLYGDGRKGNRPSYIQAAKPEQARQIYQQLTNAMQQLVPLKLGVFQADMKVCLVNDGPFTILLDSRKDF